MFTIQNRNKKGHVTHVESNGSREWECRYVKQALNTDIMRKAIQMCPHKQFSCTFFSQMKIRICSQMGKIRTASSKGLQKKENMFKNWQHYDNMFFNGTTTIISPVIQAFIFKLNCSGAPTALLNSIPGVSAP